LVPPRASSRLRGIPQLWHNGPFAPNIARPLILPIIAYLISMHVLRWFYKLISLPEVATAYRGLSPERMELPGAILHLPVQVINSQEDE
jgi:hypothetical protein